MTQVVKVFLVFYGRFIIVGTKARNSSVSWARWIRVMFSIRPILILSSPHYIFQAVKSLLVFWQKSYTYLSSFPKTGFQSKFHLCWFLCLY